MAQTNRAKRRQLGWWSGWVLTGAILALLAQPGWARDSGPPGKKGRPPASGQATGPALGKGPVAQGLPAVQLEGFGMVPPAPARTVSPALREQAVTLENADNAREVLKYLGASLSPAQREFLNQHKFLLLPRGATTLKDELEMGSWDEMLGVYDAIGGPPWASARQQANARLVNPDVALHALHKYLENSLEHLEKTVLAPELLRLLQLLQSQALAYAKNSPGDLARHYELLAAQLTVPRVILENARWPIKPGPQSRLPERTIKAQPDNRDTLENALGRLKPYEQVFSPETLEKIRQELTQIYQQQGDKAPLFGHYDADQRPDYSQFTPRSHYTKTSVLRAYFRAMMYLGRNSYNLKNPEGLTDALLLTHLLAAPTPQGQPLQGWKRIMEITGFYAGLPDDISYPEWRDFIVRVTGSEQFEPTAALSPELQQRLLAQLPELRPPVNALTRGEQVEQGKVNFRLFGQRFTFDAWILQRLQPKNPGETPPFPTTPSALFVAAALGNGTARQFIPTFLKGQMPGITPEQLQVFENRLNGLQENLRRLDDRAWFSAVGWAWLRLLTTLNSTYGAGYPAYMQGPLFPLKQLETFLGSYTELKHDTLLYSKQVYAEAGDFGELPPVPRGFVEPNVAFWQELDRLAAYIEGGFQKYKIFPRESEHFGRLKSFRRKMAFLKDMAVKELAGKPLTDKEYEELRTLYLGEMAKPWDGEVVDDKDKRSALVADIQTDLAKGQILYQGTGQPYVMLVLVANEGRPRLVAGMAFNHYEFTAPLGRRLTDADWQALVYENPQQLPPKNFWYQDLLVK